MTWQPIETALKDGTIVNVYGPEHEGGSSEVASAYYESDGSNMFGIVEGWWAFDTAGSHLVLPIVWMPLPELPVAT